MNIPESPDSYHSQDRDDGDAEEEDVRPFEPPVMTVTPAASHPIKQAATNAFKHQALPFTVSAAPVIKIEDEPDEVMIIEHYSPENQAAIYLPSKAPHARIPANKQIETPSKRHVPLTAAAAAASSAPNKKPALMSVMRPAIKAAASSSAKYKYRPHLYVMMTNDNLFKRASAGDIQKGMRLLAQMPPLGFQFMQPIKYQPHHINPNKKYTWEIKWDGNRALWDGHNKRLYPKSMRFYVTPPSEWALSMPYDAYLDGELFYPTADGTTFYESDMAAVSAVWKAKRDNPIWKHLLFHVLDVVSEDACNLTYENRSRLIGLMANKRKIPLDNQRILVAAYAKPCRYSPPNEFDMKRSITEQIEEISEQLREEKKAEGMIIKECGSLYKIGQQSKAWLKVKLYEDTEALMIDYKANNANEIGAEVELPNGSRHHIQSATSNFIQNRRLVKGEIVRVRYMGFTTHKRLREACIDARIYDRANFSEEELALIWKSIKIKEIDKGEEKIL